MTPPLAVELREVSVQFGSITALNAVSVQVPAGQKVALVGSSGAGKSSLLRAVAGQVEISAGSVHALGEQIAELRPRTARAVRARIGLIAQSLDLALPLRVIHNVNAGQLGCWSSFGAFRSLVRPATGPAEQVLEQVGLKDRLWARTDELSGGERQRVAIARVLLQVPELILADEPTASVDPKLADDMMALLCRGDHALLVSAHNPQLARRHVDRLLAIRNGTVVFDVAASDIDDGDLLGFYDQ